MLCPLREGLKKKVQKSESVAHFCGGGGGGGSANREAVHFFWYFFLFIHFPLYSAVIECFSEEKSGFIKITHNFSNFMINASQFDNSDEKEKNPSKKNNSCLLSEKGWGGCKLNHRFNIPIQSKSKR